MRGGGDGGAGAGVGCTRRQHVGRAGVGERAARPDRGRGVPNTNAITDQVPLYLLRFVYNRLLLSTRPRPSIKDELLV